MSEKRHILCIIAQGEMGGAQRFVAELANHLDHDRFRLEVIWGAESGPALGRDLPPQVAFMTVRHLVRAVSPWHDLVAIRELRMVMLRFRPDIVLCISSKAGFVGSRAAHGLRNELPNLKMVYRIVGWSFNDPLPAWKRFLYRTMERLSARWKDVIVVNNTHDLDQARMIGIRPRNKLVRIFNGIDPYRPFIDRDQARAYLNGKVPELYRHEPYEYLIGTIANFYPAKDLATLIRSAARVSENVRFVVIGDGYQRGMLERMVAEYELQNRFFLIGKLFDAAQYMHAFDLFVLPSVKEGFPWALLEAMAAKVPIVATNVGAVPEMVQDGISGIVVPPRDAQSLAAGIVSALEDDRRRREMAISAHQRVISQFSLHAMMAEYEKLFSA